MRTSFGIALLVALFVVTSGGWAGVIPVTNPSFELPACPGPGSCNPTGWTQNGSAAIWTPTAGQYNSIPDGTQVAWVNSGGSLTQVLSTALALNTTYTLTVDVGLRNLEGLSVAPIIKLLAGSTVLGSGTGTDPTAGNWTVWTLVFDSGSSNAAAGQFLDISLGSDTNQTGYDLVSLTSTADVGGVPEPAMFALVGVGLLGLVTRRRFVK